MLEGLYFKYLWKYIEYLGLNKRQYCFANICVTKAQIFMKFYVVVKYYLVSLSFKFHEDPCRNASAWVVNARTRDKTCARMFTTCAHACLQLVRFHLFTDLPEIPNLSSQDSIWQPHKISWRSELFLRRYLQNNTDVCLILNIQFIFTNIQNTSPPEHQSVRII